MKKKTALKTESKAAESTASVKNESRGGVSSKGFYRHPQPDNYVELKQYLFLRSGGEKYLLLKFENDTESVIDGVELLITEMNIDGKVIGTRRADGGKISAAPGQAFALPKKIRISKDCVDFKIKVLRATAGSYVYSANSNYVRVHYEKPKKSRRGYAGDNYSRRGSYPSKFSKSGVILALAAALTVALALGYSILTYYTEFRIEKIPEYVFNFLGELFENLFSFKGIAEP